ncbi:MAG: ATP-binding cassette domain-containing protein [Acidimicrobiia bacterium]|nr:ATP-binding cassette domain-containing protein [Acidimicrobiia bacterium]
MSTSEDTVLAAEEVVAGYVPGVDILRDCTVTVAERELVGIIGPNGAGKSTLVKAMFGLVPVRAGRVLLRDEEITGRPAHELVARRVGYVPQRDNVFATLTVADNLRMGGFLVARRLEERVEVVSGLFPWLRERIGQRAGSLSGGERQMLAMARALMTDPEILLLDEPSAGLSPLMQDEVFDRIVQINDSGVSVLMVEQNARRCLEVAHRAYVLDQGRPAHEGAGRALLADQRVAELYLGTLGQRA